VALGELAGDPEVGLELLQQHLPRPHRLQAAPRGSANAVTSFMLDVAYLAGGLNTERAGY
jgi:hypothetical protein